MRDCISEGTLQAWFDRELGPDAVAKVAAHLNVCIRCAELARGVAAENEVVGDALATEFAAAIPTERLRQRLQTAVAALDRPNASMASPAHWRAIREWFGSLRPLAYASMTTILVAGFLGVVYIKKEQVPVSPVQNESAEKSAAIAKQPTRQSDTAALHALPAIPKVRRSNMIRRSRPSEPDALSLSWQQRQYDYAIARLSEAIKVQPVMRPALRVEYEYNMAVIDNAIATGRDAARRNPTDPQAAQLMLAAYQSKVDLMNQVANARVSER
jgi:hypothetical protein